MSMCKTKTSYEALYELDALSIKTKNGLYIWILYYAPMLYGEVKEEEDLFIDPQEFVVGYSKAPEQPQSSARPICHSHAMT